MATCDTLDDNSIIDNDVISSSPSPDQVITNTTSSHSTLPVTTQTKLITDQHLKYFEPTFDGTLVIIIDSLFLCRMSRLFLLFGVVFIVKRFSEDIENLCDICRFIDYFALVQNEQW
ncbi:hypothetical protein QTP88_017691 [Uroleucon formosanum]